MSASPPEARLGTTLADRYRLDRILGRGGMGVVYGGVHTWTGRDVAVKLMLPQSGRSSASSERFLREARAAGEIRHPNVVDVLDMGVEPDGSMYMVLERLEGESVGERLERLGRFAPAAALAVLVPLLRALHTLHGMGVVHRDLKPDNLYLSIDGTGTMVPKLLDFGISKRLGPGDSLTREGALIGTPVYMSPEQTRSAKLLTAKSDLWSMGVVLYECLAGRPPFEAESLAQLVYRITNESPRPLGELALDLPEALVDAVETSLAREPAGRFVDAQTFANALEAIARSEGWGLQAVRASWPGASSPRDDDPCLPTLDASEAASRRTSPEPQIRFFEGPTGHRVAYAKHGAGPPLICAAWWVSHLEEDWRQAGFRRFFGGLGDHFTIYRYDRPGSGLSDRDRARVVAEDEVATLEALIDHEGLDRVHLFGLSCAGPTSIAYAVRRPEKVDRIVLFGSFLSGSDVAPPQIRAVVTQLVETHWGLGAKVLIDLFDPGLGPDERVELTRAQRGAASKEMAASLLSLTFEAQARDLAPRVTAPTLVLHRIRDQAVPFKAGRKLAATLPNATLRSLDGEAHVPWLGDVETALEAVLAFLTDDAPTG